MVIKYKRNCNFNKQMAGRRQEVKAKFKWNIQKKLVKF